MEPSYDSNVRGSDWSTSTPCTFLLLNLSFPFSKQLNLLYFKMFSISLDKRESVHRDISEILPWMMENHGDLSVLIHPLSDREHMIPDHQERAAWLGHKVKLNLRAFG